MTPVLATKTRWGSRGALRASLLGAALLVAPGTALARGHTVPKGTPYAAEVIATITGTSHLTYQDNYTLFLVCEEQSAVTDTQQTFDFKWSVRYPQVTVPVATRAQLGRAWKRLHVRPQPTAKGTSGAERASYEITGDAPPTADGNQGAGGSDCTDQAYSGSGLFVAGRPIFGDLTFEQVEGPRQVFVFDLGDVFDAQPVSYTMPDGSEGDPIVDLQNVVDHVPIKGMRMLGDTQAPGYNTVPAVFPIDVLTGLVHRPRIALPAINRSDSRDCGTPSNGVSLDVCTVTWAFHYNVTLTRRFLYRTKRAYAR
ncbi:MAG: hypothetical protein ACRDNS_18840 [Trebonia sp.]